jgi:hypothetical protein
MKPTLKHLNALGIWSLLCAGFFHNLAYCQSSSTDVISRVEYLKLVTTSPPVVSNLIFRADRHVNGNQSRWFCARWQPDAIFLGEAETFTNLQTTNHYKLCRLIGRYTSNYWYYGLTGYDLFTWTDDGILPKNRTNSGESTNGLMSFRDGRLVK